MTSGGFGVAFVVEDNKLVGVITDGDLRRNMADLLGQSAMDIANTNPTRISPDLLAAKALAIVNERKITALPVVDDIGAPVGILHVHDLLRAGVA